MLQRHLIFSILVFAPTLGTFAQLPAERPTDLIALRQSWEQARAQALAPLDKKYREALEAMKLRYTKAGDLKSAIAVEQELTSLTTSAIPQVATPASETSQVKTTSEAGNSLNSKQRKLRKELAGSSWISIDGLSTLVFNEDGTNTYKGDRERVFTWMVTENGDLSLSLAGKAIPTELRADGDTFRIYMGRWNDWKKVK